MQCKAHPEHSLEIGGSLVQVYHDDATQEVVVLTSIDRTAYTESFVVLEYIKEV